MIFQTSPHVGYVIVTSLEGSPKPMAFVTNRGPKGQHAEDDPRYSSSARGFFGEVGENMGGFLCALFTVVSGL